MFLSACGSLPIKTQSSKTDYENERQNKDPEQLLAIAHQEKEPKKSFLFLQSIGLYLHQKQFNKAYQILSFIRLHHLQPLKKETYYLYSAKIFLASKDFNNKKKALPLLKKITRFSEHSMQWQIQYTQALSDAYLLSHHYFEAAKERIGITDLITSPSRLKENNKKIWDALDEMKISSLEASNTQFNTERMNGWLTIVLLNKKWIHDPQKRLKQLELWKSRYPHHPAQSEEMKTQESIKPFSPKKIGILLPLSGRLSSSGKMIQNGFIAAQFQKHSKNTPSITFYDTAKSASGLLSYQQAIDDGADFIIGPLEKKKIIEILKNQNELLPTLFLNKVKKTHHKTPIFQFDLSVESEAIQAAKRAIEKGYRKALIFIKKSTLGLRAQKAFKMHFERLGGEVIAIHQYNDIKQLNHKIENMLHVAKSENRKKTLEKTLGRNITYTIRRRKDADVLFLFSNAKNARRIKPFINFYFAIDLPVITTSRIFSGLHHTKKENDLNGIEFLDIPLYLSQQNKALMMRNHLLSSNRYLFKNNHGRLFSLGFDAYQIASQLPILQAFPAFHWDGLSGEINVDSFGIIHRQLTWAKFKNGKVEVTKELFQSSNSLD
jgi:outer membrane PBP1 activator LpoA protein